jgi:hypothetical protein
LSKNAYVALSLVQFGNRTNSNHLEKCLIITKTYWLCRNVQLNGLKKSKLHQYPSPIINKGYRWNIGALKDAWTWSHTIHYKQIVELAITSFTTNIVYKITLYELVEPQNGPTLHEHASQGCHVVMGEAQPSLVHLPASVKGNYLPIWIILPYAQHDPFP